MKTLVAPLNWGLGHASRCVALVRRLLASGDEVVIGGDGESLALLRQHFPELRYVELAPLELRYSRGNSQMWTLLASIPKVLRWMIHDHRRLQEIQRVEQFDRIVSDNRFGCWVDDDDVDDDGGVVTVYMTHQVHICLPHGWQWAEGIASRIHACVYNKYKELWIPDYEEEERSLAGRLSHGERGKREMGKGKRGMEKYIGPLSRFESLDVVRIKATESAYDVVAVLSGLEPQRTMLEEAIRSWAVRTPEERVLIVRGKVARSANENENENANVDVDDDVDVDGNVVMVDSMGDDELARVMMGAKRIIARSGYSTIMDLACLELLDKAELIPTPGQSEQEYLKRWIEKITNK